MKTLFFLLVLAWAGLRPALAQNTQLAFAQAAVVGATTSQATNPIYVTQAVADAQGNTYFTGEFGGTVQFGAISLTSADPGYDVFVAKRDAAGVYQWAVAAGGAGGQWGQGLALDGNGDVVVTGYFQSSTARFGGVTLTNASPPTASLKADVFVAKLSGSTRTWLWAVSAGGGTRIDGQDYGRAVAVDVFGNIYVAGTFDSSVAFFGAGIQLAKPIPNSLSCVFLAKLTTSGQWVWAKGQDSLGGVVGGVSTDPYGDVYLTGAFGGAPAVFGAVTLTTPWSAGYVAKIDGAGTWQWAQRLRTASYAPGPQMYVARSDGRGVYLAGFYQGDTLQMGATTLRNTSYFDSRNIRLPNAYVARLHAGTGAWQWVLQTGGVGTESFSGPQFDGTGHVLVAGGFAEATGAGAAGGAVYGTTTLRSAAGNDQVVAQLDTAGRWLWVRQANTPMAGYGTSVYGINGQGQGLLLGAFGGTTLQVGPFALNAYPGQPAVDQKTAFTAQLGANGPLTASKPSQATEWAVYPNPARTAVTVTGLRPGQAVQVLDVLGRTLLKGVVPVQGDLRLSLPPTMPAGLYLVRAGGRAQRLVVE